jgi:hypothetical protein
MHDPVFEKLKTDAGIVLADLWRAFRHQPPVEATDWQHPRVERSEAQAGAAEIERPSQSGLCYFHLN